MQALKILGKLGKNVRLTLDIPYNQCNLLSRRVSLVYEVLSGVGRLELGQEMSGLCWLYLTALHFGQGLHSDRSQPIRVGELE